MSCLPSYASGAVARHSCWIHSLHLLRLWFRSMWRPWMNSKTSWILRLRTYIKVCECNGHLVLSRDRNKDIRFGASTSDGRSQCWELNNVPFFIFASPACDPKAKQQYMDNAAVPQQAILKWRETWAARVLATPVEAMLSSQCWVARSNYLMYTMRQKTSQQVSSSFFCAVNEILFCASNVVLVLSQCSCEIVWLLLSCC